MIRHVPRPFCCNDQNCFIPNGPFYWIGHIWGKMIMQHGVKFSTYREQKLFVIGILCVLLPRQYSSSPFVNIKTTGFLTHIYERGTKLRMRVSVKVTKPLWGWYLYSQIFLQKFLPRSFCCAETIYLSINNISSLR